MSEESIFINRELSWLDFNRRVLVLGKDKNVPLAEQLKFLAIYGSNLDEFFMVRVGSLQERANLMRGKKEKRENKTNMTAEEQLAAIMPKTAQLQEDCDKYYDKAMENLAACGYRKVDFDKLSKEDEHFWKKYFQSELFPILSPQIVDSRHPFPFLRNKEIYLGVLLHEKHTSEHTLGIVPISSQMERMHFVRKDNETCFALTEELVLHYAALIFGKENVQEKCLFRVTRNADIDVKEGMMDHDIDYREIMADLLKRRRKLAAVRLQVIPAAPQVAQLLCSRLELTHKRVFVQKSPLDLSFFYKLTSRMESDGHPELFYTPARPMLPPQDYDLAAEVEKHDVLLSYPYQSIRPFIAMLKKAAQDSDVISIKMTLYRMARESQIVQALVEAAENGKEVVALVELRARFDEQNNIDWSKHLEEAGCTVIYGFDDYKVHSKLTLITKKSAHGYSYITQIGTGNYNEKTSELYTDYSFIITADLGIGEEASNVFQNLAVQKLTEESEKMLVAPLRFKSVLLDEMDRVINAARLGRPASMILKNNSISDRDIILKLEEASCAGVRIDMIVRGICCVRAGMPGKTENLHIRSLVGRYLEHGRIYSFYDGVNTRIYIASGDFLTRNTECRVEVGVRVEDPVLKEKLDSILRLQLSDNVNAREMQPDGSYQKVKPAPGEPLVNSQMGMYDLLRDDWTARDKAPAPASVAETPKPQPVKAPEKPAAPAKAAPQPARPAEPEEQPAQPEKAVPALMPIVVTESRPRRTGLLSRLLEHFLK